MKKISNKSVIPLLLSVSLATAIYPFSDWMPSQFLMSLLIVITLLSSFFLIFLWREEPADEREASLILISNRSALTAASTVLTIAIIISTIQHQANSWLIITLLTIVIIKTLSKYKLK